MKYSISATPSPALLGASVTLTLTALADVDTVDALTFEHKSLTIELHRVGRINPDTGVGRWEPPTR